MFSDSSFYTYHILLFDFIVYILWEESVVQTFHCMLDCVCEKESFHLNLMCAPSVYFLSTLWLFYVSLWSFSQFSSPFVSIWVVCVFWCLLTLSSFGTYTSLMCLYGHF